MGASHAKPHRPPTILVSGTWSAGKTNFIMRASAKDKDCSTGVAGGCIAGFPILPDLPSTIGTFGEYGYLTDFERNYFSHLRGGLERAPPTPAKPQQLEFARRFFVEVSGGDKIFPLWRHYSNDAAAIVFIVRPTLGAPRHVDFNEGAGNTMGNHGEYLRYMLQICDNTVPLLVLVNHTGTGNPSDGLGDIARQFRLYDQQQQRRWTVMTCNLGTGEGLREVFSWLLHVHPTSI